MATPMELSQRKDAFYSEKYAGIRFRGLQAGSAYKVATGSLVLFKGDPGVGRVLSRVDATGDVNLEKVSGHLCVAALGTTFTFCYVRWVDPKDVWFIAPCPTKFMAAFFGKDVKFNHVPVSSAREDEVL